MSTNLGPTKTMQPTSSRFTNGFCACPVEILTAIVSIDIERVEELYRRARHEARAVLRAPVTDRLAPWWN
jgi:hypothetical protein